MNIIVLVKQVPDTTEMKIDKEKGTLIRTGVPSIINPDDLAGLEEALKIKGKLNAHIRVITMGPPQAKTMLQEILGRGVDEVVLVSDGAFAGADTWATSNTLAAAIKLYPYDLIIAGRQAIDGDTAQVGPQVAENLGLPQVTYIKEILEYSDNTLRLVKENEDTFTTLEVKLPALITTLQTMNKPRYANVIDLWNSFEKEIVVITNKELELDKDSVGLKASPTKVRRTFTKPVQKDREVYTIDPIEAAKEIAKKLLQYVD